ncbi:MAG TPA: galactokinase [Jatrophihabitantaceae bacterium]|nr:galactokinase [Jatrophihabitantaceae bacterium]
MAAVWRAPGRVNLIGEHTDYNEGFVLPFAIEHGCTASVEARTDRIVALRSAQQPEPVDVSLDDLHPGVPGWAGYPLGVVWALRARGYDVPGLTIELDSDVPVGAGLSSSAALVCSVATAVDELLQLGLTPGELLAITRSAENDFVGAPTGGMDQLAALNCTAGAALFCDMRSLDTQQVPLVLDNSALFVVDTKAEHRHADGEYRRRRAGCEQAARQLGVRALRDVDAADLDDALDRLADDELRRYTRHVVTENARVLATVAALRAGELAAVGPLLTASHASMRDDFRITGPELDLAADTLLRTGADGARLTGGGFGGCVVSLIDASLIGAAGDAVRAAFADHGFATPATFVAQPSGGAHQVVG